jgi:competence protein ComEA
MKAMRSRCGKLALRLVEVGQKAAAWRWGSPVVRAAAAVLGLVVLAAIGRSALARTANRPHDTSIEPSVGDAPVETPPESAHGNSATGALAALVANSSATPPAPPPPVDAGAPDAGDGPPRGRATPDDPVYLNQATIADLRRLPGVGAKRAQAILTLRDRIQHFRQIEDLLKVKGMGRASLRKLRPLVRLDWPSSTPDAGVTLPPPSRV